jgi:hypothetical protein
MARWWTYTGSKSTAVVMLLVICCGGVYEEGAALLGTRALAIDDLRSPPIGRYVDVSCDSLAAAGEFKNGYQAYLCKIDDRLLPVVGGRSGDEAGSRRLAGRLREFRDERSYGRSDTGDVDFIWPDEVLSNPEVVSAYLEIKTRWEGRVISVMAILAGIFGIVLSVRWRVGPVQWWKRQQMRRGRERA